MGEAVSTLINSAKQKKDEAEIKNMAFIDSVIENLENQSKQFQRQCVQEIQGDKKLPISRILKTSYQIRCSVATSVDEVAKSIEETASKLMDKEFAGALSTVLSTAITVMVGKKQASSQKKRSYSISVGEMGGVMRIDYMISVKNIQAQKLQKVTTNIMSVSYILSSVDLQGMNANDLVAMVQVCYNKSGIKEKMQVLKRIIDLIQELKADQDNLIKN